MTTATTSPATMPTSTRPRASPMTSSRTLAYLRSEVRRTLRNRRYMVFTIVTPLLLFLLVGFAGGDTKIDHLTFLEYIMVSMATFGTLAAVYSRGGAIAQERSTGWNRQLRLTALTGPEYVVGKIVTGFVTAVPSLVVIFAVGAIGGVHLSPVRWLAISVSILLALLPIAALGVWVGYLAKPDSAQAIGGAIYTALSLLGGLWSSVSDYPQWLQDIVKVLPMYWIAQSGRTALVGSWVGWTGVAVVAAWTVLFSTLAGRAYRQESGRA